MTMKVRKERKRGKIVTDIQIKFFSQHMRPGVMNYSLRDLGGLTSKMNYFQDAYKF